MNNAVNWSEESNVRSLSKKWIRMLRPGVLRKVSANLNLLTGRPEIDLLWLSATHPESDCFLNDVKMRPGYACISFPGNDIELKLKQLTSG